MQLTDEQLTEIELELDSIAERMKVLTLEMKLMKSSLKRKEEQFARLEGERVLLGLRLKEVGERLRLVE